jgi:hypothetical protein
MTPSIEIKNREGEPIHDLKQWRKLARGKAAVELARAWLDDAGPEALRRLMEQEPATSEFEIESAVAPAQARFGDFAGSRDYDLLLSGEAKGGRTVVAIEGRTDEGFGQKLGEYLGAARRRMRDGKQSDAPERLKRLTTALAGWEVADNRSRLELRYQLFTGVAGTLAAAVSEEADQAVFCVHEIVTPKVSERDRKRNEDDLRRFMDVVFSSYAGTDASSWLVGPLRAFGGSDLIPSSVPLFIAKVCTEAVRD